MDSYIVNWYRSFKKARAEKHAARVAANIIYLTDMYDNWLTNEGDGSMVGWLIHRETGRHMIGYTDEEEEAAATVIIKKLAKEIKGGNPSQVHDQLRNLL